MMTMDSLFTAVMLKDVMQGIGIVTPEPQMNTVETKAHLRGTSMEFLGRDPGVFLG